MSISLEAKCEERDELCSWLGALEGEDASLEAIAVVRAQLERVEHEIARLKGLDSAGFSFPASASR